MFLLTKIILLLFYILSRYKSKYLKLAWFYFLFNAFKGILAEKSTLKIVLGLEKDVAKGKSFNKKDFSISLHKNSILLFYLVYTFTMLVIMAKMTILAINFCTEEFIVKSNI